MGFNILLWFLILTSCEHTLCIVSTFTAAPSLRAKTQTQIHSQLLSSRRSATKCLAQRHVEMYSMISKEGQETREGSAIKAGFECHVTAALP